MGTESAKPAGAGVASSSFAPRLNLIAPTKLHDISPSVVSSLYFSTSSKMPNHSSASLTRARSDGRLYQETKSMEASHALNWQRPTRDDCTYNREFYARPLENRPQPTPSTALNPTRGNPSGNFETTHQHFFKVHTEDGRGESYKPRIAKLKADKLLETKSSNMWDFPKHDQELAQRFRGVKVNFVANDPPVPRPCEAGASDTDYKRGVGAIKCLSKSISNSRPAGKPKTKWFDTA